MQLSRHTDNTTEEQCDCVICSRPTFGSNFCLVCEADSHHYQRYQPSKYFACRCEVPHCLECHEGRCLKCTLGYTLRSYGQGVCVRNYYHPSYTHTSGSNYSESNIDYSDTYSVGLLPLVLVSAIIVMALRRMRLRRRLEAQEISLNGVLSTPVPMPTDAAPNENDGNDGAGGGTETSPLLTQSQRATKSNSVLVVGPSGTLGVGVEEKGDESPAPPEGA